jgi:tetratricopeptide (TPR) repeat protein
VGGLRVEKSCPECGTRGIFFEVIPTKYFSIFWIPVKPMETKKPLLECQNCHERFYIQQSDYLSAIKDLPKSKTKENKVIHLPQDPIDFCIVPCDNCGQKLKVPKNDKMLGVTCPSCKNTFNFQKGEKVYKATPTGRKIRERPIREAPASPEPGAKTQAGWLDQAVALEKAQDWPGLLAHCLRWTQVEPHNYLAWSLLGVAYEKLGRWGEASEAYREVVRLEPDYADACNCLGGAYALSGNRSAALEAVKELRRYNPQMADKLFNQIIKP